MSTSRNAGTNPRARGTSQRATGRGPKRVLAPARGHCRTCKKSIDVGDRIAILAGKWHHAKCLAETEQGERQSREALTRAPSVKRLAAMPPAQRLQAALDAADRAARAARMTPTQRRRARIAALEARTG